MTETGAPRTHGRYALIPTHNRHDELTSLVATLVAEADLVIVVDNASSPPVSLRALREAAEYPRGQIWVMRDEEQPPNLARMWNAGFDAIATSHARREGYSTWDVAVLNDDAVPYPGWLTKTADAMRAHDAGPAAACSLPIAGAPLVKTKPDRDLGARMYGPAFVVRGELTVATVLACNNCNGSGIVEEANDTARGCPACHGAGSHVEPAALRADERMRWWWQDTDLDWQARGLGGMLVVPGPHVPNRHANESTVGELAEQAGRDGEIFVEKWGFRPW